MPVHVLGECRCFRQTMNVAPLLHDLIRIRRNHGAIGVTVPDRDARPRPRMRRRAAHHVAPRRRGSRGRLEHRLNRDSPDAPPNRREFSRFSGLPARQKRNSDSYRHLGQPGRWSGGLIWQFSLAFGRTPPIGSCWTLDHRASHAGAGGGCGRNSAISRRISWNNSLGTATSAIWKMT